VSGAKVSTPLDRGQLDQRIVHAHRTARILRRLGWSVSAIGVLGIATFLGLWMSGHLDPEQAASLIIGTLLASVLSGVSAYGAGVNIALSADRLAVAIGEGPPDED